MTKPLITILFGLAFFCTAQTQNNKSIYPKDPQVSKIDGTPKDSMTYYYPNKIQLDTGTFNTKIEHFPSIWFSGDLYAAKEPILFNYYLGKDMYRFLWLRSFDKPIVFVLCKSENQTTLTTKVLNREANPGGFAYDPRQFKGKEKITEKELLNEFKGHKCKIERFGDSLVTFDYAESAKIIYNKTKKLSKTDWNQFEILLNEFSFWSSMPYARKYGLDGSEWTIEGHLKDKYWFVNRWSPEDKFKKVGEYLIKKSGLKVEIY